MTERDETYNGWRNRETWAIQLHLSNNEGDYRLLTEWAEEIVRDEADDRDGALSLMADRIEGYAHEIVSSVTDPEDGPPTDEARMFVADVGSLWRADFHEIAEEWIESAMDEVPEDERAWYVEV